MNWFDRIRGFLADVRGELKRSSWPSKAEVQGTTLVVILTVFVFALFLWVVDTVLFNVVEKIFAIAG